MSDPNVLFMTFEQMKSDIASTVHKVACFLGTEYAEKMNDASIFENILRHCDIKSMKKDQQRWCKKSRPESMPFIRKGEIGDWKNHLSEEQSNQLDEKFKQRTRGSVFEHLWDDVM